MRVHLVGAFEKKIIEENCFINDNLIRSIPVAIALYRWLSISFKS